MHPLYPWRNMISYPLSRSFRPNLSMGALRKNLLPHQHNSSAQHPLTNGNSDEIGTGSQRSLFLISSIPFYRSDNRRPLPNQAAIEIKNGDCNGFVRIAYRYSSRGAERVGKKAQFNPVSGPPGFFNSRRRHITRRFSN